MTVILEYVFVPIAILVAIRLFVRFPISMAVLLCIFGPLLGAFTMVIYGELFKPHPNLSLIPSAALFTYFFFALPIFGLSVATVGVLVWLGCVQLDAVTLASTPVKVLGGAILGAGGGGLIALALYGLFSLDPSWPSQMRIFSDSSSLSDIILQGAVAGMACGVIIARYLNKGVRRA